MRSPTLTALFNPLGIATLAVSVAAWWLFPLGLVIRGVMVYGLATDPARRYLNLCVNSVR